MMTLIVKGEGNHIATSTLEHRAALLGREPLALKQQLLSIAAMPWWEQISGVFAAAPAFDEAAELDRRYRESQRPAADEDTDVPA